MWSFMMYALHQILFHQIRGMRWEVHKACMGEGRGEVHTGFWWRNLMERLHLERPRRRCVILKWIFMKQFGGHGLD